VPQSHRSEKESQAQQAAIRLPGQLYPKMGEATGRATETAKMVRGFIWEFTPKRYFLRENQHLSRRRWI